MGCGATIASGSHSTVKPSQLRVYRSFLLSIHKEVVLRPPMHSDMYYKTIDRSKQWHSLLHINHFVYLSIFSSAFTVTFFLFTTGYYWIDPNLGNIADAMQVYCSKPGCSCLECDIPSAKPRQWQQKGGEYFTEYEDGFPVQVTLIVTRREV